MLRIFYRVGAARKTFPGRTSHIIYAPRFTHHRPRALAPHPQRSTAHVITTIFPRIYARLYYGHPRARVMSFSQCFRPWSASAAPSRLVVTMSSSASPSTAPQPPPQTTRPSQSFKSPSLGSGSPTPDSVRPRTCAPAPLIVLMCLLLLLLL